MGARHLDCDGWLGPRKGGWPAFRDFLCQGMKKTI